MVLFLAGANSSACMVGLDKGEAVGRPMRPKNASTPLSMALLDASGIPLPLLHGQLVLAWANNNSTATPRTLAMTKVASLKEGGGGVGGEAASRLPRLRWGGCAAVFGPTDMSCLWGFAGFIASAEPFINYFFCLHPFLLCCSLSDRPAPSPLPTGRRSTAADSNRSWSRADSLEHQGGWVAVWLAGCSAPLPAYRPLFCDLLVASSVPYVSKYGVAACRHSKHSCCPALPALLLCRGRS